MINPVQIGATIDYAIVMTERYKEFRKDYNKFDAITKTIQATLPTLITSGGILVVAGFTIGLVSTVPTGPGALTSRLQVLLLLPQLLLLADKIIQKREKIKTQRKITKS